MLRCGIALRRKCKVDKLRRYGLGVAVRAEQQPGYHSSGRSAALFTPNYGTDLVRLINRLSNPFFVAPREEFTDRPLLRERGALTVAGPNDEAQLDSVLSQSTAQNPIVELSISETLAMAPFLRSEYTTRAVYETGVSDIEASVLLQSYIKVLAQRGGQVVTGETVVALKRRNGVWTVSTEKADYQASTVVNAAGAWADQIGKLAGATLIGLVPKRRTANIVEAHSDYDVALLPCVDFSSNGAYIKPEAGQLMVSPGDATPVEPQDVQPDEMDVALLVDWLERETHIPVQRIAHSWAGLRSFVSDGSPVIGQDSTVANFIRNAGHGGYGIMMAPALSRAVASLCHKKTLPADFNAAGITEEQLSCSRLG